MTSTHTLATSSPLSEASYTKFGLLTGHNGVILCMSITEDGKLASGGLDGVRLWDLRKVVRQQTSNLSQLGPIRAMGSPSGAGSRGSTTALAWIRREDEPDDGLIFGTASGYVVSWRETTGTRGETCFEESFCIQMAKPGEVTAITFEAGTNRLAISNRNSVVQVFQVGPKLDLHCIFSVVVKNHVPKAIAFGLTGEDKDLYTFGLYDGTINTGTDGKVKQTRQTGCPVGNACINFRHGVFCIDDPTQGVALYRSDASSWERIRTCPVKSLKSQRPRQVTFTEDCKFIISASNHGVVYVFDRRSGKMVDELKSGEGRIQAITATEQTKVPLIFSAMHNGDDAPGTIVVWKKNLDSSKPEAAKSMPGNTAGSIVLKRFIHACMIVMAAAFLWQNFGHTILAVNKWILVQ